MNRSRRRSSLLAELLLSFIHCSILTHDRSLATMKREPLSDMGIPHDTANPLQQEEPPDRFDRAIAEAGFALTSASSRELPEVKLVAERQEVQPAMQLCNLLLDWLKRPHAKAPSSPKMEFEARRALIERFGMSALTRLETLQQNKSSIASVRDVNRIFSKLLHALANISAPPDLVAMSRDAWKTSNYCRDIHRTNSEEDRLACHDLLEEAAVALLKQTLAFLDSAAGDETKAQRRSHRPAPSIERRRPFTAS